MIIVIITKAPPTIISIITSIDIELVLLLELSFYDGILEEAHS